MSQLKKSVAVFLFFVLMTSSAVQIYAASPQDLVDFSEARIVIPRGLSTTENAAVQMLVDEVRKRSSINLTITTSLSSTSTPAIVVVPASNIKGIENPFLQRMLSSTKDKQSEGYSIKMETQSKKAPNLFIVGNDQRGVLYGVGYLLRKAFIQQDRFLINKNIEITTHPALQLRGHQLGYRPKTNSYDGFTVEMWEDYIKDLIVFGTNSIELVPPNTDDISQSPMFNLPAMDMMVKMDKIIKKYGLNAWMWYPLTHGDYSDSDNIQKSLKENEEVFRKLPKIDAIFIPGGDPGDQSPDVLFNYLEKQAKVLHKYHPKAEIWVSPQGFDKKWMSDFFSLLENDPEWLTGIVYGPGVRIELDEFIKRVSKRYPIRRYPDITHNYESQYPVPEWDYAFAATENRESINPRPVQQNHIFNLAKTTDYSGFITYSEGINDDVNKMIWSSLGWNPKANIIDILQDYSRYFIGPDYAYDFAEGILDLEKNWEGSLIGNNSVYNTLLKFQSLEDKASPRQKLNWRFQQALYRAYYDAYIRSRLIYETHLEDKAMNVLREAPQIGSELAINKAQLVLDQAVLNPVSNGWKQRIFELGEALFQSIRMQKSVEKYYAKRVRRGANLDLIDYPLNNRMWLQEQFKNIKKLSDETDRLEKIQHIVNWQNPGPGGFYDDLGNSLQQPHLVKYQSQKEKPSFLTQPFTGFKIGSEKHADNWKIDWADHIKRRVSWLRYAQTQYDAPLRMHYSKLDTTAQYKIRVIYSGDNFEDTKIRLRTNENAIIHSYIKKPKPLRPLTFDIPVNTTKDGELTLIWNQEPGQGGNGRGCQIAEVWLIKAKELPNKTLIQK